MTRSEIFESFRAECPELPSNVISDTLLAKWCLTGDKEVCARARCIVSDTTFASVVSTDVHNTKYDLTTKITKFYDIDSYPGSGIIYDNKPLIKTTVAELDSENSGWRDRAAGTPKKYYRREKFLYFDYPVVSAKTVRIYYVLVSDDFNTDNAEPYNGLAYLEPFHYGIVKYLVWRGKQKMGKAPEAQAAQGEFIDYTKWMAKELGGGKYAPIRFQGPAQGSNSYGV